MASTYDMSAGIHMFSLAIQEGLTIDRLRHLALDRLPLRDKGGRPCGLGEVHETAAR